MLAGKKSKIFDVDLYCSAAVLAIGALTWLMVIQPLDKRITQCSTQERQHQQEEQSLRAQLVEAQTAATRRKQLAATLSKTPNILQDKLDMSGTVRKIAGLARRCGLSLDEIVPDSDIDIQRYGTRSQLKIQLTGQFGQFIEFLIGASKELQCARIAALDITRDSRSGGASCSIAMQLDVFGPRRGK